MYVYLLSNGTHYKVGIAKDVGRRIKQLQTGSPTSLSLVAFAGPFSPQKARLLESSVHKGFHYRCSVGEWFQLDPKQVDTILSEFGKPLFHPCC
jgi:hypothetical protein